MDGLPGRPPHRAALRHLQAIRPSTITYHLVRNLLYRQFRDPGEEPPLHLFADLKRIARRWIDDGYLVCKCGTFPAQLLYQEIADMAGERIFLACQRSIEGEKRIKAIPDPYNPEGSSRLVNFTTSKATRWRTSPARCHVNWVVCDSNWEAEFARVAEEHPRVLAYVKNQGLGVIDLRIRENRETSPTAARGNCQVCLRAAIIDGTNA